MLLQTNSYIVPPDRRADHARLVRRFRQMLLRLGCANFEVYEQVGANWSAGESSGRFVQIMRFTDRKQQLAVQNAERHDPQAQAVIAEFCDLINFPAQQQQGLFALGFYTSVLSSSTRRLDAETAEAAEDGDEIDAGVAPTAGPSAPRALGPQPTTPGRQTFIPGAFEDPTATASLTTHLAPATGGDPLLADDAGPSGASDAEFPPAVEKPNPLAFEPLIKVDAGDLEDAISARPDLDPLEALPFAEGDPLDADSKFEDLLHLTATPDEPPAVAPHPSHQHNDDHNGDQNGDQNGDHNGDQNGDSNHNGDRIGDDEALHNRDPGHTVER